MTIEHDKIKFTDDYEIRIIIPDDKPIGFLETFLGCLGIILFIFICFVFIQDVFSSLNKMDFKGPIVIPIFMSR